MSSEHDFERLVREARETLPGPDGEATDRARAGAHAAAGRRRPHRVRVAALIGACVLLALALGIGIALVAPSGTASRGPVGLGFVPEPGWYAFQTGGQNGDLFQTVAVASNVPLAAEDQVAGAADSSGLPYATLLGLERDGIVIVATFSRMTPSPFTAQTEHELELPLRMRDAAPLRYGTQLRPDEPLAQYEIRGLLKRHLVDVFVYFGAPKPSRAHLAEADRQLREIVVRRVSGDQQPERREPAMSSSASAPVVFDRTVTCAPALIGGVRQVDTIARGGSGRRGAAWASPALASARTTVSGSAFTAVDDNLVWVAAGVPAAEAEVLSVGLPGVSFPFRSWGTLGLNARLCRTSAKPISLSRKGLSGGPVGVFDDRWDCVGGRRVLIRVRASLQSTARLGSYRGFLRTTTPVESAKVVIATSAGKPLSYAEVSESGESRLFVAPGCTPD
jgi:hypothetical protein